MTNILVSIFCAIALVAFSSAKELSSGPQAFEESSSAAIPKKIDKRYTSQVITLYLTPNEMKALADANDAENSQFEIQQEKEMQQSDFQNYNMQQQMAFNEYKPNSPVEEPKAELRGLLTHSLYPKEAQSNYENQQWNFDFRNSYSEQKSKEEQKQITVKNEAQDNLRYQEETKTLENSPAEEPKAELRGLLTHSFYPKEAQSNYENQQWNYDFSNSYSEQKPREEQKQIIYSDLIKTVPQDNLRYQEERKTQQDSPLEQNSEWTPLNPEPAIEGNTLLYGQVKQQENNNFDQNSVQLNALSTIPKEYGNTKETNTKYTAEVIQLNSESEEKSEIEKQIELILRHEQAFEEEQKRAQAEANKQRPPIIIHKEVSVTKHLPVPVLKRVKVPTPVLVPIPEPYEVKIPQPYPVPFKVIKHIPIPVLKQY